MKKKILGSVGVIAIALVVFFTTSTNANNNDTDLLSLLKINTANAECTTSHNVGGGKCLSLSKNCVGDPGNNECDFGW